MAIITATREQPTDLEDRLIPLPTADAISQTTGEAVMGSDPIGSSLPSSSGDQP